MARIVGPQLHELPIFLPKTDPLLILIFLYIRVENFQNGPFWANWQTPIFQNGTQNGTLIT